MKYLVILLAMLGTLGCVGYEWDGVYPIVAEENAEDGDNYFGGLDGVYEVHIETSPREEGELDDRVAVLVETTYGNSGVLIDGVKNSSIYMTPSGNALQGCLRTKHPLTSISFKSSKDGIVRFLPHLTAAQNCLVLER